MNDVKNEILTANADYVATFGEKANLPMPPGRHFLVLTCMDARLDPAKFAGLSEGDAHVFRNAGGRVTEDAIRSLVISHKFLGTDEWFIIHHTDCGLEYVTDQEIGDMLTESLETADLTGTGWVNPKTGTGRSEARYQNWLAIDDHAKCLRDDIDRLRHHPLVDPAVTIHGLLLDTKTGRLEAME